MVGVVLFADLVFAGVFQVEPDQPREAGLIVNYHDAFL
jgi:hypothetical protein